MKEKSAPKRRCGSSTGKSALQSVIFDRDLFTEDEAADWLTRHHKRNVKVDVKPNTLRFRQFDPDPGCRYVTQSFGDSGIKGVLEFPSKIQSLIDQDVATNIRHRM